MGGRRFDEKDAEAKEAARPAPRGCYGLFDPLFIVLSLSIDKAHLDLYDT